MGIVIFVYSPKNGLQNYLCLPRVEMEQDCYYVFIIVNFLFFF